MFSALSNTRQLRNFCLLQGAGLFGIADIRGEGRARELKIAPGLQGKFSRAVCLGAALSQPVLSELDKEPTKLYFHHYRTANMFLDQMAFAAAQWIRMKGFRALPVPASQITDWEKQEGHLSHKQAGRLAGLGWIGRNNLLVSRRFGAQARLVTVLTDMPLRANRPTAQTCGRCFACVEACPAGAIGETPADFKHLACFERLKDFQKQGLVGQFVCGICVNACGPK